MLVSPSFKQCIGQYDVRPIFCLLVRLIVKYSSTGIRENLKIDAKWFIVMFGIITRIKNIWNNHKISKLYLPSLTDFRVYFALIYVWGHNVELMDLKSECMCRFLNFVYLYSCIIACYKVSPHESVVFSAGTSNNHETMTI